MSAASLCARPPGRHSAACRQGLVHRTDTGSVRVDLRTPQEVAEGYRTLAADNQGTPPADTAALADALLRVSRLEEHMTPGRGSRRKLAVVSLRKQPAPGHGKGAGTASPWTWRHGQSRPDGNPGA